MAEDEKVGWHHRLNGHESEQTLGVGDGQGNLACCSPWGHKELDTTERLNNNKFALNHFLNEIHQVQRRCRLGRDTREGRGWDWDGRSWKYSTS